MRNFIYDQVHPASFRIPLVGLLFTYQAYELYSIYQLLLVNYYSQMHTSMLHI